MQGPRNYSAARKFWEGSIGIVSAGGWPARLAYQLGFQRRIVQSEHTVKAASYPEGLAPLRITFASDFHAGPTTHPRLLDLACEKLAAMPTDVLLLGGDFVSFRGTKVDFLARLLGQVPAPLGRFAVLGNHDHWAGGRAIADSLEHHGIRVLTNSNVSLPAPYQAISICGLDDHTSGWPDAERAFAGANGIRIALLHAPSGMLDVGTHHFDLAFCGHTHGGQIVLPNGFPPFVPMGPLSRKYVYGRYEVRNSASASVLIVSRGVGCSTLPIRVAAESEIVSCALGPTANPW